MKDIGEEVRIIFSTFLADIAVFASGDERIMNYELLLHRNVADWSRIVIICFESVGTMRVGDEGYW
jgi:hypothetical protein